MKLTTFPVLGSSVLAILIACSSSSGIDSSAELGSLSTSDQMSECNTLASMFPPKTVDCGLGSDNPTVGEDSSICNGSDFHAYPSSCTATVGDAESCLSDIYGEGSALCSGTVPSSCAPLEGSDCTGG